MTHFVVRFKVDTDVYLAFGDRGATSKSVVVEPSAEGRLLLTASHSTTPVVTGLSVSHLYF
jgi:hypothetical protein